MEALKIECTQCNLVNQKVKEGKKERADSHVVRNTVRPSWATARTARAREGSTGCGTRKSSRRCRRLRYAGLSATEVCPLVRARVCSSVNKKAVC